MRRIKKEQSIALPLLICVGLALLLGGVLSIANRDRSTVQAVTPPEKPIEKPKSSKRPKTIVGSIVNVVVNGTPTASLQKCVYHIDLSYKYRLSGSQAYVFNASVTNHSSKAIDATMFYVRCKSVDRTVPVGETVESIDIAGGIEPGETKVVTFDVPFSTLGVPTTDEVFEVAIVDEYPAIGKKPYQFYTNADLMIAEFYDRPDPAMRAFLGELQSLQE